MFSRLMIFFLTVAMSVTSCTSYKRVRQMRTGEVMLGLSVREDTRYEEPEQEPVVDSMSAEVSGGPIIMNAIRDTETGEMVATDVISASKVTARFRNVAERDGYVTIGFDITVPESMMDSRWRLKILPNMLIASDTLPLMPVYVTGKAYRNAQLRGYQRYRAFLASIVTDTTDMIRMHQLEIFLERHFPQTYMMKNDTSIISSPRAESLFGVTQLEALRHYTRHWKVKRNEWKKRNRSAVFGRFVKDPVISEGAKLDTVITAEGGLVYQYNHTFRSRPGLRKVMVSLDGKVYENGNCVLELPFPQDLTFYISSLSSLVDTTVRYRMQVLERTVYDHTLALIDFDKGSFRVDTLLGDNASELRRVHRCVDDVIARSGLVLDSLVVRASCSPEGAYRLNERLSLARSKAVTEAVSVPAEMKRCLKTACMPENWGHFRKLVSNDTLLGRTSRDKILKLTQGLDVIGRREGTAASAEAMDKAEAKLSGLPEYKYLREKIYPQLRSVSFEFHLHREGMVKDTVHTTVVDSVYMSGVEALKKLDYKTAVGILRPYRDYNAALACLSMGYDHSALDILEGLDLQEPRVCYLMAMVLSRLERYGRAMECFEKALELAPALEFRANLDPEMSVLIKKRERYAQ